MGDVKVDSVPILSSANGYKNWAAKMKGYFIFIGCWDVVTGDKPKPSSATTTPTEAELTRIEAWEKLDSQARGLMFMRIDSIFHYHLETKVDVTPATNPPSQRSMTAAETWAKLAVQFGTPGTAHVWGLFESLVAEPR